MILPKKIILTILLVCLFLFSDTLFQPVFAQTDQSSTQTNDLKSEIDYFLDNDKVNAAGYLVWQFTVNPQDGDDYSFYQGSPICDTLKAAASAHSDKFVGVNSWALGKNDPGTIDSALGYLSTCGVTVIRIWGTVGDPVAVLNAAKNHGIRVIVTLGDYSNGSPGLPSFGTSDPTKWYATDYQGEYKTTAGKIVSSIKSSPGRSQLYGYELANEPHCSGYLTCIPVYVLWAQAMGGYVKTLDPGAKVGIGQMASHDTTRGDSPGYPTDFAASNAMPAIDIVSGHYYNEGERQKVVEARSQTSKTFYIGEAPTTIAPGGYTGAGGAGATVTKSDKPLPQPYVACDQTRPDILHPLDKEFHSLRPYEASPCNPKVEQTINFCGNDFYAKETFNLFPGDGLGDCSPSTNPADPPETLICKYNFQSAIDADIRLDPAELPILGNTQLVPNSINQVNQLDFPTRMNNYVSWYLNGAVYRAEENVPAISDLLAYSGPLRKLLPSQVQDDLRTKQVEDATLSLLGAGIRHNQVFACTILGLAVPCYSPLSLLAAPQRLTDAIGSSLINKLSGGIFKTPAQAPMSSTEDKTGEITAENKYAEGSFGGNTFYVSGVNWEPDSQNKRSADDIYFAHTEESAQLAEQLQSTFAPKDAKTFSNNYDDNSIANVTPFCDIKNYRTNPGDSLFGTYNNKDQGYFIQIKGTFDYQVKADRQENQVTFHPSYEADPNCPEGQDCPKIAIYRPQKRYAYVALQVFTKSPLLKEIWERLVSGSYGVAKRFFPKDLIKQMKDIPAETQAIYDTSISTAARGDGTEAIAGSPYTNRSGDDARLFFPHLGSVEDYFLQGIQCALRPQGMCGSQSLKSQTSSVQPLRSCTIDGSGILSQKLQGIISNAATWAHVPVSVLTMVVKNEAHCPATATNNPNFDPNTNSICEASDSQLEKYVSVNPNPYPRNCAPTSDSSAGPLQMQDLEWNAFKGAFREATGNTRTPDKCVIEDAVYAAAYELSAGIKDCPNAPYDVTQNPTSWSLDQMKVSLSHWAAGCSLPTCDASIPANNYYCGNIESFNTSISSSCK